MKKIVVGISGGIDSAVTAAIFKKKGFEVLGLHLIIDRKQNNQSEILTKISNTLCIPITTLDVSTEFNKIVIAYFRDEHLKGNSPSPCAYCNPTFKWKFLNDYAKKHNAKHIASGHYIQKTKYRDKWYLKKGIDSQKDQSYFLWGLSQEIIGKIETPLGEIEKSDTKRLAKEFELEFLIKKKESAGLCFAGNLSYPELIAKHIPEAKDIKPGDIIDRTGKKIGSHKGYIYYTIGQKRDLNLPPDKNKFCVTGINAKSNILIAGEPTEIWHKTFKIKDFHFIDFNQALSTKELEVNVRGFGWNPNGFGRLSISDQNTLSVELDEPAWAPAPGQPAVFYYKDLLLGGGIIC
jgi:tRNA-uridine 2-sulfurtransferase